MSLLFRVKPEHEFFIGLFNKQARSEMFQTSVSALSDLVAASSASALRASHSSSTQV